MESARQVTAWVRPRASWAIVKQPLEPSERTPSNLGLEKADRTRPIRVNFIDFSRIYLS